MPTPQCEGDLTDYIRAIRRAEGRPEDGTLLPKNKSEEKCEKDTPQVYDYDPAAD